MKTEFSEMLSSLRRERGISQKRAAKDLEISQALLSHYENGVREPKFEFIDRACAYYGVSADYLLGRQKTDALTVTCRSPYTMDMANNLSELISKLDGLDEKAQHAAAEYFKNVLSGVKSALQNPETSLPPEAYARQLTLLAELYGTLRDNK